MINSQPIGYVSTPSLSISKGMGDQFSASAELVTVAAQYIKGDG